MPRRQPEKMGCSRVKPPELSGLRTGGHAGASFSLREHRQIFCFFIFPRPSAAVMLADTVRCYCAQATMKARNIPFHVVLEPW
jgi:hypothetical protein